MGKVKLECTNYDSSLALDYADNFVDEWNNENYNKNWQDALMSYIDDTLIYYDDQWEVLKEYCNPQDADWNYAFEQLIQDIYSHIEEVEDDEEEDDDDEIIYIERFKSLD